MPWRNGLYVRLQSWVARAAAGAPISAVEFDADGNDEASALNNCVLRDGTGSPTADLPMAGHSLTGIRQAAAAGEPMEYAQVNALVAAAGGTVVNKLHNASFLVNQRATSTAATLAAGVYGHDRWKAGSSGCTYTTAAQGADVQASVASGSLLQVVVGSDVDSAAMTLSNAGTAQARIYPLGGTAPAFAACPVSASGLTAGQAIVVEFSTGTVLQPQLEGGATAHSFARKQLATDRILCQQFFEKVYFFVGDSVAYMTVPFKVTKRSAPTFTTSISYNPYNISLSAQTVTNDCIAFSLNGGSAQRIEATVSVSCEP